LLVICCWLLVISYWLLVISYWLFLVRVPLRLSAARGRTSYWLLVIGCWTGKPRPYKPIAYCLQQSCLLPTASHVPNRSRKSSGI